MATPFMISFMRLLRTLKSSGSLYARIKGQREEPVTRPVIEVKALFCGWRRNYFGGYEAALADDRAISEFGPVPQIAVEKLNRKLRALNWTPEQIARCKIIEVEPDLS